MRQRRYFLGTLSAAQADNWRLCKAYGLWGAGGSSGAKHASREVWPGDLLFVWQAAQGLMAVAELRSPAQPVQDTSSLPWPTPEKYLCTFAMRVLDERDEPVPDRFVDHRSVRFNIQTHQVQNGFTAIDAAQAELMAEAFDTDPFANPLSTTPSRATSHADPPIAAIYVQPSTSVVEAMLALWRRSSVESDDGVLLVVGPEDQREGFLHQLTQAPFSDVAERFRFSTPAQLAAELESGMGNATP